MFQASLVAERQRQWLLARFHAEQALEIYRRFGDTLSTARLLNNLAGIDFLLGDVGVRGAPARRSSSDRCGGRQLPPTWPRQRRRSPRCSCTPTGRKRRVSRAEASLALLAGRVDFLEELGNAQLVIAKSYGAELDAASAAVWLDQAELHVRRARV